jgi:hypothetical protein
MAREIKAPPVAVLSSKSFDGKHEIAFNESSHRYKWLCACHKGEDATGVTTFLKQGLPTAPGLISWMKGQALEHLWNAIVNRETDLETKAELFKEAKLADRAKSQEAADIGTVLHSYAELHSLGKVEEAKALLQQVSEVEQFPLILKCVDKYHEWDAKRKGVLVAAESLVASPAFNYCGKIDRLDKVYGKLILRDYKTSKAIFVEQKIQLAMYRLAIFQWLGLQVDAIEILRFGKTDGEFETELIDDPKTLTALEMQGIRCRQTHSFMKEFDKK